MGAHPDDGVSAARAAERRRVIAPPVDERTPVTAPGTGDLAPTPPPVAFAEAQAVPTSGVVGLAVKAVQLVASHADEAAFPLLLLALLVAFLMLQDRVDRRDPKLAAPLAEPDLTFPEHPRACPSALRRCWGAHQRPIEVLR